MAQLHERQPAVHDQLAVAARRVHLAQLLRGQLDRGGILRYSLSGQEGQRLPVGKVQREIGAPRSREGHDQLAGIGDVHGGQVRLVGLRPVAQPVQRLGRAGHGQRQRKRPVGRDLIKTLRAQILRPEDQLVRAVKAAQQRPVGALHAQKGRFRGGGLGQLGRERGEKRSSAAPEGCNARLGKLPQCIAPQFVEQRGGQKRVRIDRKRQVDQLIGRAAGLLKLRAGALGVARLFRGRERLRRLDPDRVFAVGELQARLFAHLRAEEAAQQHGLRLVVQRLMNALHLLLTGQAIQRHDRARGGRHPGADGFTRPAGHPAQGHVFVRLLRAQDQRVLGQKILRQRQPARRGELPHRHALMIRALPAHQLPVDQPRPVAAREAAAVEYLHQLLAGLLVGGIVVVRVQQVERPAIGRGDRVDVLRPLEPPLQLERRHARLAQLHERVQRHQILRGQQVALRAHRPLQSIGQAAGLGALTPVAAAAAHEAGKQALPRAAHAQRAVAEDLDLDARVRALGDFLQVHLPRQHRARKARVQRELRALGVVYGHLRAGVQAQRGQQPVKPRRHAQILHDRRVHAAMRQLFGHVVYQIHFAFLDHRVDGHMNAHVPLVGVFGRPGERLPVEIARPSARVERRRAQVDRVRPGLDRRQKRLFFARGGQQLDAHRPVSPIRRSISSRA